MLIFFFFNDTATTEIYTLSLHDALPIFFSRQAGCRLRKASRRRPFPASFAARVLRSRRAGDRKSTRLNSSHSQISYAVFCLKKKKIFSSHIYTCVPLFFASFVLIFSMSF